MKKLFFLTFSFIFTLTTAIEQTSEVIDYKKKVMKN